MITAGGRADAPFDVLAPLPRQGRFQGFSADDVIYLVMPDRFANGDARNDDPARSRGLLDRSRPRYYHGGDLQGLIDRLPYLADLGVTALWLNPVCDNVDHLNERRKPSRASRAPRWKACATPSRSCSRRVGYRSCTTATSRGCAGARTPRTAATFREGSRAIRATPSPTGRSPEEQATFEHLRKLAGLRKREAALRRGSLVQLLADEKAYAFARVHDGRAAVVAFNAGAEPREMVLPPAAASLAAGTRLRDALGSGGEARVESAADGARVRLTMAPRSAAIFVAAP